MAETRDLNLLIESGIPLIALETHDEQGALELLTRAAIQRSLPLYRWSCTDGLRRAGGFGADLEASDTEDPLLALRAVRLLPAPALVALLDLHPFLGNDPKVVRALKDLALHPPGRSGHTVVLVSHQLQLPPELSRLSARLALSLPSENELLRIIREEAQHWSQGNQGIKVRTDRQVLDRLVRNLRGLSEPEVRRLARQVIRDDGAITDSDLPRLNQLRHQLLDRSGLLSFEYETAPFREIAGLQRLKAWLELRRHALDYEQEDWPRGLLLVGVQGGGKSLAAKATAGLLGVPLLRLEVAALYNKYIGESERQLREALASAASLAPCVLWIDEIEKALAAGGEDGTAQRVRGMLLTWLAERRDPVFVVATANDIRQLPPELLRKGRLDEVFFVDLPQPQVREEIFAIHLRKRGYEVEHYPLTLLAELTDGFTGAEIEQLVVTGIYQANAQNEALQAQHLETACTATRPLSVLMAEQLQALRAWAAERAVMAD